MPAASQHRPDRRGRDSADYPRSSGSRHHQQGGQGAGRKATRSGAQVTRGEPGENRRVPKGKGGGGAEALSREDRAKDNRRRKNGRYLAAHYTREQARPGAD